MNIKNPVLIAEFNAEFEAEAARLHLKGSGIDARIVHAGGGGIFPDLQIEAGAGLVVDKSFAERAEELLEDFM